ncbi:hypothetical protein NHX12_009385 [Muraenolepis orangiensis]|uniref:Hexosyltransferase n=1 Tax=Muraenolepis orangiensis TaxID=630683 RepID=A0A9Q0DQP1_9TELE|nr:hypothetical protein NHX12_009385 [Muraenolepis orangiensis]
MSLCPHLCSGPKKRIQTQVAMGVLCSTILLFVYSNWQMDEAHRIPAVQGHLRTSSPEPPEGPVPKPRASPAVPVTPPLPLVLNVTVSEHFRKFFPLNGAYWSRLLHYTLRQHDQLNGTTAPEKWSECREANRELLKTNMHDFDAYPDMHKDFLRGLHCQGPPLLIDQPQKCTSDSDGTFLLLAIKSAPSNFEQRQAVRETWGREAVYQGGLRVHTLFLLGSTSDEHPHLQPLLMFEALHYRDVLQWDFHESLFNLTLKMHTFIKWSCSNCPAASFVFSGDDDVFVNTPAMVDYLRALTPAAAAEVYVGEIISVARPMRELNNKYYVPLSFYENVYPPYAGGGGFLMSGALMGRLSQMSALVPLYPIDDVYVGMCMQALGISPKMHRGFQTFDVAPYEREYVCRHKQLLLIHRRTPRNIKLLWKGINSPLLTC